MEPLLLIHDHILLLLIVLWREEKGFSLPYWALICRFLWRRLLQGRRGLDRGERLLAWLFNDGFFLNDRLNFG
jgi:hypothetical protein